MKTQETLDKLYSLQRFGVKLGLNNITSFLSTLGNPQLTFKTIHIAGSNGKGSTASFIASILSENGLRTGLYTSPHFVRFNERIKINGIEIDNLFIADFFLKNEEYIKGHKLTFFEVTTALAFEYYREKKIDVGVIETGLGGRLDATNVLNPLAVVITSVSMEHTNVLGSSISQIAWEKSAIIKPAVKVFTGKLNEEAKKVISKKVFETNSQLYSAADYVIEKENKMSFYCDEFKLDDIEIPLAGKYQKYNAALAALTVTETFNLTDPQTITAGWKNVTANTGIEGRYEIISKTPKIILDSAHNPEGVENFTTEFAGEKENFKTSKLLFGAMKDKNIEQMLYLLKPYFNEFYFAKINYERAASIENMLKIAHKLSIKGEKVEQIFSFIREFENQNKPDTVLVVLGSMYLIGEIKSEFYKETT